MDLFLKCDLYQVRHRGQGGKLKPSMFRTEHHQTNIVSLHAVASSKLQTSLCQVSDVAIGGLSYTLTSICIC